MIPPRESRSSGHNKSFAAINTNKLVALKHKTVVHKPEKKVFVIPDDACTFEGLNTLSIC